MKFEELTDEEWELIEPLLPPPLSPPHSTHTTHKPACQSAHQQFLSAVHKAPYLAPFSPSGVSSGVRALLGCRFFSRFSF